MRARYFVFGSILACTAWAALLPGSEWSKELHAEPARRVEPMDLLPESTLLAIEIRDVDVRWGEIRAVPTIARLQDRILGSAGIDPADLPRALGDRAVIALVADEERGRLLPLAVLRPTDPQEAVGKLRDLERAALIPYSVEQHGDLVTIAPESIAQQLQLLALGQSTASQRSLVAEVDARLPEGGLIRGWLDPQALSRLMRDRVEGNRAFVVELLTDLFSAELGVMRFVGFRRDLTPEGIVTDAVLGFDMQALPPEVRRVFRSPATAPEIPESLPSGVVALASFGTESGAVLPWLRHVSESDPRGTLRNLNFWLAEFETSSGVDLERELLAFQGERAWLALFAGSGTGDAQVALLCETRDAERLEQTLLELRSWMSGHLLSRTLGLAALRNTSTTVGDEVVHDLALQTPFGELQGPRFLVSGDWLILGNGEMAVTRGKALLRESQTWKGGVASDGSAVPNESVVISGPELAKLFSTIVPPDTTGSGSDLSTALAELLADLDIIAVNAWYEIDVVRLHGRVHFR